MQYLCRHTGGFQTIFSELLFRHKLVKLSENHSVVILYYQKQNWRNHYLSPCDSDVIVETGFTDLNGELKFCFLLTPTISRYICTARSHFRKRAVKRHRISIVSPEYFAEQNLGMINVHASDISHCLDTFT